MHFPKIPLILTLCAAFSLSCSTTTPEPVSALAPAAEAANEEDKANDSEELLFAGLQEFSHRNEVQGDLQNARWADLEPTLPDSSAITLPPTHDLSKALESALPLECSEADSFKETNAVMIFCSKPNQIKQYEDDGEMKELSPGLYCTPDENSGKNDCSVCPHKMADVVYLGLTNPRDKSTVFYPIARDIDLGLIFDQCSTYGISSDFSIIDVQVKPFMDTTAIYVRTVLYDYYYIEHCCDNYHSKTKTFTTWLFAGDKYRLVTSWTDTIYSSSDEYEEDLSCNSDNYDDCIETTFTQSYTENYLYYESGKFSIKSQSANSPETLQELLSKRP